MAKMYSIIRLIFSGLFFCFSALVINKIKPKNAKKIRTILIIISVVIYGVLLYIPFENSFITFDSPKSAAKYYNPRNSNIELIVNGDGCDFVVIKGENITKIYSIIPKTSDGWKIGTGKDVEMISHGVVDGFFYSVYQYKKTNNYFVRISNYDGDEITFSDTFKSDFQTIEQYNKQLEKSTFTYYTHVTDFDQGYYIEIESEDGSVFKYNLC